MSVVKFAAAAASGSSGMFAEGVRSAVNCGNSVLLALGQRRCCRPADTFHPFGYGMELYFWTLVAAVVLFAVAGVGTVIKGVSRILHPQELTNVGWSYAVLALAALLAANGWRKAWAEFRAARGGVPFWRAVELGRDTTTLTVLSDSSASLVGLLIAFLGLLLAQLLDLPMLDGLASVLVGLLIAAVAGWLVIRSKRLLVGASASAELKATVREQVEADGAVSGMDDLLTMHLGPRDVLAIAVVRFRDGLSAGEVAEAAVRLTDRLRAAHPELTRLFVHPASEGGAVRPGRPGGRG